MSIVTGRIRSGGRACGRYLLTQGENESVRILDVDGMTKFTDQSLIETLGDFTLNEKLTRSRKGLYHATINPEMISSHNLTDKQWFETVDILAAELGFSEQRRVIVLHKKLDRVHAHVVFERYDHENRRMIPIDHNYKKHDRARAKIEARLKEQPTPQRNPKRGKLKEDLTRLWRGTSDAKEFLQAAKAAGYSITAGSGKIPYMVVDDTGRSFNLRAHLDGIRIGEIRRRLNGSLLMNEKKAIALARTRSEITQPTLQKSDREKFLESLKQQHKPHTHKPRMR